MKTLNEVIKAFEICWEQGTCNEECPYKGQPCTKQREIDALYYLRQYQKDKQIYSYDIARRNMEVAERNDPLSWDELLDMQGKPVWIDSVPLVRRWVIIKKFHPIGGNKNLFDMEVEDGAHFLRKNMRRDDPAWWQAYRKERTE